MHYLYTDGSHANELNIAGIGGYLLDNNKKQVWSFSNPLYQDLPHHELKALDYALVRCLDSGIRELTCYTDALNIVRDIGKKEVKHNSGRYHDLFDNVVKLLPHFKHIDFHFIPREQNKKANYLARKVLTDITSKQSRVKIFQSLDAHAPYFKSERLFCSEQFVDKKKITNIRNSLREYYVFDLYRGDFDNTLDVYQVFLSAKTKAEKIHTYVLRDTWRQYVNAVNQTLQQTQGTNVGLMLCPSNNEVDNTLRGMRIVNPQYQHELQQLSRTLEGFNSVLVDADSLIYQTVFQKEM